MATAGEEEAAVGGERGSPKGLADAGEAAAHGWRWGSEGVGRRRRLDLYRTRGWSGLLDLDPELIQRSKNE